MTTTLGINLKVARGRQRFTAEELAEKAGVTSETIRLIENGTTENPQAETLVRLADALGVTVHELVREPAAPGSTVSAANHDRPSTIHENQHDQHRREDARGDSDVSPSLGSDKQLPPPAEADEGISRIDRKRKGERCQG